MPDEVIEKLRGIIRECTFIPDASDKSNVDARKMSNIWERTMSIQLKDGTFHNFFVSTA